MTQQRRQAAIAAAAAAFAVAWVFAVGVVLTTLAALDEWPATMPRATVYIIPEAVGVAVAAAAAYRSWGMTGRHTYTRIYEDEITGRI